MKTVLNSLVAWLRSKPAIDESMITSVTATGQSAAVELLFSTEKELAEFGAANLQEATVTKLDYANGVVYRASLLWRKRQLTIFLKVSAEVPRPASEAFSPTRG